VEPNLAAALTLARRAYIINNGHIVEFVLGLPSPRA
jgi:hypothetical protein